MVMLNLPLVNVPPALVSSLRAILAREGRTMSDEEKKAELVPSVQEQVTLEALLQHLGPLAKSWETVELAKVDVQKQQVELQRDQVKSLEVQAGMATTDRRLVGASVVALVAVITWLLVSGQAPAAQILVSLLGAGGLGRALAPRK